MFCRKRTPVFRIRKWRGGHRHYRKLKCGNSIRNSQHDEDQPSPRAARFYKNLHTAAWDDFARCYQRCWKSQHRGRKAWQR